MTIAEPASGGGGKPTDYPHPDWRIEEMLYVQHLRVRLVKLVLLYFITYG